MKCPCLKCPDRAESCHAHCERYAAFRQECDARILERKKRSIVSTTGQRYIEKLNILRDKYGHGGGKR